MLIAGKYEVPEYEYCLGGKCFFKGDLRKYGQNSICTRCPLFVCVDFYAFAESEMTEEEKKRAKPYAGPMVPPEDFRPDWAEQWFLFFEGKIDRPVLNLYPPEEGSCKNP